MVVGPGPAVQGRAVLAGVTAVLAGVKAGPRGWPAASVDSSAGDMGSCVGVGNEEQWESGLLLRHWLYSHTASCGDLLMATNRPSVALRPCNVTKAL